ncbi:MAG TPA: preprotein translocase subunit SecY [Candidatus Woesebacteria bacterium]|nr:preprotein translocase subunit SecY [Candidatus Woesebacteria bacterium]HRS22879.1 preprotein translocase subunit SecY [Candidatus Woesebacteria bacterium]HRT39788.1 preprotein translocase subunit SecY [Candidatus Woesebacteria bacterium]
MNKLIHSLSVYKEAITIPVLRQKILFTLAMLVIFRLIAHIPVPGVNLALMQKFFNQNQILALVNMFSGGTLANFSIVALGLNPYINASVMMQLLALVIPQLAELQKEGEYGRARINQYIRVATIPIALIQSIGMYSLLRSQQIIISLSPLSLIALAISMVSGTMIMVFLGEMINLYGVGNGISMMIFGSIISHLPVSFYQTFSLTDLSNSQNVFNIFIYLALALIIILGVVFVEEAVLRVPVHYARRGQTTFLPIKVDTAGVMPIIFAVSLATIPSLLGQFLSRIPGGVGQFGTFLARTFRADSSVYVIFYFLLVVAFTFFYTSVIFKPKDIADELRKTGAFIPGIRPGVSTQTRLQYLITRVIAIGAVFLGLIAIVPSLLQKATGLTTLSISGTGILIIVSVVIELTRKIENVVQSYNYEKLTY